MLFLFLLLLLLKVEWQHICLVPVRLLQFPSVCCLGAWVPLVSVTSPRRMADVTEINLGVDDCAHGGFVTKKGTYERRVYTIQDNYHGITIKFIFFANQGKSLVMQFWKLSVRTEKKYDFQCYKLEKMAQ